MNPCETCAFSDCGVDYYVCLGCDDRKYIEVSRYDYELEFMPQMLVPVKIRADEIKQDFVDSMEVTEE